MINMVKLPTNKSSLFLRVAKGDVVLLTYTPDPVYAEYSVNWKFVTVE